MHKIKIPQACIDRVLARRSSLHVFNEIDPRRTAHVVVDLQNGFMAEGQPAEIPLAREIVPNVNRISRALRAAGGQVVYIQNTIDAASKESWSTWFNCMTGEGRRARMDEAFREGSHGHALYPTLEVLPADLKVKKSRFGAFVPGASDLHSILQARDPEMARRLAPGDTQRITRALEVFDATGRSLAAWQQAAGTPLLDAAHCVKLVLDRPRAELAARTDARFLAMLDRGALDEARRLAAMKLDPTLTAMRAVGLPPLLAHLAGDLSLPAAVARAQHDTRRYIKRQQNWQRKFMADWHAVPVDAPVESLLAIVMR